jgi:hypothetical protein
MGTSTLEVPDAAVGVAPGPVPCPPLLRSEGPPTTAAADPMMGEGAAGFAPGAACGWLFALYCRKRSDALPYCPDSLPVLPPMLYCWLKRELLGAAGMGCEGRGAGWGAGAACGGEGAA